MELVKVQSEIDKNNFLKGHEIDLYVDSETGVQYFVMNRGNAGAICPRFNADGTLYISKPQQR